MDSMDTHQSGIFCAMGGGAEIRDNHLTVNVTVIVAATPEAAEHAVRVASPGLFGWMRQLFRRSPDVVCLQNSASAFLRSIGGATEQIRTGELEVGVDAKSH